MMVKICGITNREDAEAAVDAGATALGFNFYRESPRFVTPERAAELAGRLSVTKVGIFVNETADAVERALQTAGLDIAQVYSDSSFRGLRTWRACRVESPDFALPEDDNAEAFLLDGFSRGVYGGSGQTFRWSIARNFDRPIVLAGGLDAANVREASVPKPPVTDSSRRS